MQTAARKQNNSLGHLVCKLYFGGLRLFKPTSRQRSYQKHGSNTSQNTSELKKPFLNKLKKIPVAVIDVKWSKSHPLEQKTSMLGEKRNFKACPKNFHSRHKALTETFYLPFKTVLPMQKHNLEPQTKAKFVSGKLCPTGENTCHNNTDKFNIKCDQHSLSS